MVNTKERVQNFIDEIRPQVTTILKKTQDLEKGEGIMVWIAKDRIEFTASCGETGGYKEQLTIENGKVFAEVTISKKAEVLDDCGDVG